MTDQTNRLFDRKITLRLGAETKEMDLYSEDGARALAQLWTRSAWQRRISYQTRWLGIPIIQLPEDILIMQELIYKVKPTIVIETGTAHGGTAVLYASMLELLGKGRVISIDVEIREHNRLAIQSHPMAKRITLIEGSSVDDEVQAQVKRLVRANDRVLVALDSNHTYSHVLKELEKFGPLVSPGSYMVAFDGVMETLADAPDGKPEWATDNPAAAIRDFLENHSEFEPDPYYNRLMVTYCPGGFLKKKETVGRG
jgi:cephalosporin hydroxylase